MKAEYDKESGPHFFKWAILDDEGNLLGWVKNKETAYRIIVSHNEMKKSLIDLLKEFITGSHYETMNPYIRKSVQKGMKALARVKGMKQSDWLDAMKGEMK